VNFLFFSNIIIFLIPSIGFMVGGGKLFELRNYQYAAIFLSICLLFLYKKNIIKNSFFSFSEPNRYCKYALIISSFLTYLFDSLSQYYGLRISGIDFSIFEGLLQNAILGNWGFEDITNTYHFGIHQNWILFPVLPFYYIFPSPLLLVLIGAFVIWLPGLAVIHLAKELGYNEFTAYLSAICWWICPFTVQAFHGNFYPELFYPLFIFCMFISYLKKKNIQFLIFIFLFLSVKEDALIYMSGFCTALFIRRIMHRNNGKEILVPFKIQFFIALICLFFLIINFIIVKPYFLNKQNIQEVNYLTAWWGAWGNTPSEILIHVMSKPFDAIKTILISSGWKSLYIPMLFIPLLNLEVFLASAPFIFLYGIAISRPSEYSAYYPIVLWCFALYGLLKSQFVPKWIVITILLFMPIFLPSWLGVEKLNWQEWKNLNLYKKQMNLKKTYCLHEGLWPYLSSLNLKAEPFSNVGSLNCIPVFSLSTKSYPQREDAFEKFYKRIKFEGCIKYQLGGLVEVNPSPKCSKLIRKIL
jgi:uncharacterized membrane protein